MDSSTRGQVPLEVAQRVPAAGGLGPLPERDLFPEVADNSLDDRQATMSNILPVYLTD